MENRDEARREEISNILLLALQDALERKIDRSKLNSETTLRDDLGLDSLAMLEMVWEIEKRFGIQIHDTQLVKMKTIGDVISVILELVDQKSVAEQNA